jgi:hypothetical protein
MLTCFDHFTPSISYAQDMNIHSANNTGGNNTSAPIYWRWSWIGEADRICRKIFSICGLHGIAYLKSQLDAPLYLRSYNSEENFYSALPIPPDIA